MKKVIWALSFVSGLALANDDLRILAEAVYFEARSEPLLCQIVVAQTILNRVDQSRYPDTIRGVVYQRVWSTKSHKHICQYSYFCDGKADTMTDTKAVITSYQVASMALHEEIPDMSEGADHYYAHNLVTPNWAPALKNLFICNEHTFGNLDW